MNIILAKLRETRREKRMTTYAVAQKVGISQGHYSMIENGQRKPSLDVLSRIIDALGIKLEELGK